MARRRSSKSYELSPWASANINNREPGGYAQVDVSLFENEAFQKLSPQTKYTYLCMIVYAKGHKSFEFPQRCFRQFGIPHGTARAAIDSLIENKFIQREYSGKILREANRYEFCLGWKLKSQ